MIKARLGETCNLPKRPSEKQLRKNCTEYMQRGHCSAVLTPQGEEGTQTESMVYRTREETTLGIKKGKSFGVMDTN